MDFIIAVFAFELNLQTDFATVAISIVIVTTSTTAITEQWMDFMVFSLVVGSFSITMALLLVLLAMMVLIPF